MSKRMYHPCHKLSVPSAKLFWCRHCMQMFEDAIARWKHSKKCHASPGYKHKDNDARVIQLYVKPDTVSYTSNIVPGQAVYHKPLVKKTSTDLKCVICGTKFFSLYDMRNHVKEPCQRSEFKHSVASTQIQFSDNEDDTETFSSLKIRRVESEEEEKVSQSTALSVLAEASKHVESLSHGDIIIEQVIEEEVPQVVDSYPHISQTFVDSSGVQESSSVPVFQDSVTFGTRPAQEVVVAYPRPTVRPELGTVIFTLQTEDGNQISNDSLDLDTIQESLRETALTLPVGQVIQIHCCNEKLLQFIVGFQGVIWPLEDNKFPLLELKERTENAALFRSQPPSLTHTANKESAKEATPNFTQIFTNSVDINITNNIQADYLVHPSDSNIVSSQEVVVTTEDIVPKIENSPQLADCSQQIDTTSANLLTFPSRKSASLSSDSNTVSAGTVLDAGLIQNLLVGNQPVTSSEIIDQKPVIETRDIDLGGKLAIPSLDPNSASLIEALLRSGAVVSPRVNITSRQTYTLPSRSAQIVQSSLQDVNTMACGKQLADNLFGFAELTGEIVEPPSDDIKRTVTNASAITKDVNADVGISKIELQSDLIKRDENEVIVPILYGRSGVKKFKVLAREMVEDDEDIRRPDSSERDSPNSTEQRKENINIDRNMEKKVKQKATEGKPMKKPKVNVHAEKKGNSLKSIKKLKITKQTKTIPEKVHQKVENKYEIKKGIEKTHIKLKPSHALKGTEIPVFDESEEKNKSSKSCEAQTELESLCDPVPEISPKNVECRTAKSEGVISESDKHGTVGNNSPSMPAVNVECSVKLKRHPSIENLCKYKLGDESSSFVEIDDVANESELTDQCESPMVTKKAKALKCSTSMENLNVNRQLSAEESRQKAAEMVFNANVRVRKSGRLQSAKCASRYRGDYGIRVDTYKQLISRTESVNGPYDNSDEIYEGNDNEYRYEDERVNETDEQAIADVVKECVRTASISVDMMEISDSEPHFATSKSTGCTCGAREASECVSDEGIKTNRNNSHLLQEGDESERNVCDQNDTSTSVGNETSCEGGSVCVEIGADISVKSETNYNSTTNTSEIPTKTVPCTSSMAGKNENPCKCDKHFVSCNECCRNNSEIVNKLPLINNADISSHKKEVSCGPDYLPGEFIAKEFIAEKVLSFRDTENDFNQSCGYVHSVGKSVKRKRVDIKKMSKSVNLLQSDSSSPPESSPVKDPGAVLENLRLKLFEKAGADVIKADNSRKQFESALISSKRRVRKKADHGDQSGVLLNDDCECGPSKDSDHLSTWSGKSTPRCTTPRLESNQHILEEVAQSLDILQKVKRKSEPSKRQKFEDKQFMLRSMVKKNGDDLTNGPNLEENKGSCDDGSSDSVESGKKPAKVHLKRRSTRSSVESASSVSSGDITVINSGNDLPDITQAEKKSAAKPKSVKCSACGHTFKTRELMRKHFPCRVRQTRTWSQNKLRPNRAVKRTEACPKKFVCQLPKSSKADANKHRPQLLTYRKTKFRRVKGKRRRRLYLLIQELKQKRRPVKWPHLGVIYDDLSFKEQCLYKLGLICIGQASEGLERYTAEDITLFEQHRAREKLISESTLNFQHSLLADSIESSINGSINTDTTESENVSTSSVINTSQESQNLTVESGSVIDSSTSKPFLNNTVLNDSCVIPDQSETVLGDTSIIAFNPDHKEMHELAYSGLYSAGDVCACEKKEKLAYEPENIVEISEKFEMKVDEYSEAEVGCNVTAHNVESDTSNGNNNPVEGEGISSKYTVQLENTEHETSMNDSGNKCTSSDISESATAEVSDEILNQPQVVNPSPVTGTESFEEVPDVLKPDTDNNDVQDLSNKEQICQESHASEDTPLQVVQDEGEAAEDHASKMIPSSGHYVQNSNESADAHPSSDHPVELIHEEDDEVKDELTYQSLDTDQMEIESNDSYNEGNKQNDDHHSFKSVPIKGKDTNQTDYPSNFQLAPKSDHLQSCLKESPTNNSEMLISINKRKSKYAVSIATDIEFFHQTANIDKDILAIDEQDECLTKENNSDIDSNLIQHASELLQDILGDVEQTVNDGNTGMNYDTNSFLLCENKSDPLTQVRSLCSQQKPFLTSRTACSNGFLNNTSTPVKSSYKSSSKNNGLQALRETHVISPIKANENIVETGKDKEMKKPSPEKKKIDLKTYASRKGMINLQEMEENEKEVHRRHSESYELNDDFLDRLINAVNVIDSIIEDQKESSVNDVKTDFNAITPELACELATSKVKPKANLIEEDSKPYDIESFPYTEDDLRNTNENIEVQTRKSHLPLKNREIILVAESCENCTMADGQDAVLAVNFDKTIEIHDTKVSDDLEEMVDKIVSKNVSGIDNDAVLSQYDIHCTEVSEHQDTFGNFDSNVQINSIHDSINKNGILVLSENVGDVEIKLAHCDVLEDQVQDTMDESGSCFMENKINTDHFDENGIHFETNNESSAVTDIDNVTEESVGSMIVDKEESTTEDSDIVDSHSVCFKDKPHNSSDLHEDKSCISEDECVTASIEITKDEENISEQPLVNEQRLNDFEFVENKSDENCSAANYVFAANEMGCNEEDKGEKSEVSDDMLCYSKTDMEIIASDGHNTSLKIIACQNSEAVNLHSNVTDNTLLEDKLIAENNVGEETGIAESPNIHMVTTKDNVTLTELNKENVVFVDSKGYDSASRGDLASDHADVQKVSIKESKRDFTIKYEMNGLVIKEDLLTGDKKVVENSSPFRSTSESQSNADHASQLESDISHMSTSRSDKDDSFVSEFNIDMKTDGRQHYTTEVETYDKLNNEVITPIHNTDFRDSSINSIDSSMNSDSYTADVEIPVKVTGTSEMAYSESPICSGESTLNDSHNVQILDKDKQIGMSCSLVSVTVDMDHESMTNEVINNDIDIDSEPKTSFNSENNYKIIEEINFVDMPIDTDKSQREISVSSPPTLEKVDKCDTSTDIIIELPATNKNLSVEGSPPVLEPVEVDEEEVSIEQSEDHDKLSQELEARKKNASERHFLDVLESVFDKPDESLTLPEKSVGDTQCVDSSKFECTQGMVDPEITNDPKNDDSIGRHFSDVIAGTVEETQPLTLQSLLDISEKGEVTLAQIKQILSPQPNKGYTQIQKGSLLKIKSSIATLLASVKKPTKKDPAWLKRDSLSQYTKRKATLQQRHCIDSDDDKYAFTDDDNINDDFEISSPESDNDSDTVNSVTDQTCKYDHSNSKGSVTDNILQMLTSLEDKGSLADNMTNLLDILAEHLVFLGSKSKDRTFENDSLTDSDSDHTYSDEVMHIPHSSSTESTQKELIADYLGEDDQPPSLDDIPMAEDNLVSENFYESMEKDSNNLSDNQQDVVNSKDAEFEVNNESSDILNISKDSANEDTSESLHLESNNMESKEGLLLELESENLIKGNGNTCLNCDKPKETSYEIDQQTEPKVKASTLFKSITELNSIETDEESNCDETYDPITMSATLSKLKENSAWEFNSNYSSDRDMEDHDDFDIEIEKQSRDGTAKLEETISSKADMEDKVVENKFLTWKLKVKNDDNGVENIHMDSKSASLSMPDLDDDPVKVLLEEDAHTSEKIVKNPTMDQLEVDEKSENENSDVQLENTCDVNNTDINDQQLDLQLLSNIMQEKDVKESEPELPIFLHDSPEVIDCASQTVEKVNDKQDSGKSSSRKFNDNSCITFNVQDKMESVHLNTCENDDVASTTDSNISGQDIKESKIIPDKENKLDNFVCTAFTNIDKETELDDNVVCDNIVSIDQNEDSNVTMTYEESDESFDFSFRLEANKSETVSKNVETNQNAENVCNSQSKPNSCTYSEIEAVVEPVESYDEKEEVGVSAAQITKNTNAKSIEIKDCQNDLTEMCAPELKEHSSYIPFKNEDISGTFCETIAEKVKRKQRSRCKSVCYNFNPLLYYSSAYAKEATQSGKKEFSVFRSSILEKRAREKYLAHESADDYDCSARKKRYSSVPKDMSSNVHTEFKKNNKDQICNLKWSELSNKKQNVFRQVNVKPCYVALQRLSKEVIEKYTSKKRKYNEDSEPENRPPIKVTIKLSQIVYPPNSPYGSTSVSSDACRSGYESNSESSDVDDESVEKEPKSNSSESHLMADGLLASEETLTNVPLVQREPLKIKMRTLLTKINHKNDMDNVDNKTKVSNHTVGITKSVNVSEGTGSIDAPHNDNTQSLLSCDLKQPAEKPNDVLFYLSDDSDSATEIDSLRKKVTKIVEQNMDDDVINPNVTVKDSVDNFIHGDCGESDVDLSASDSDPDVQEEIIEILKANSKANLENASKDAEILYPVTEEVVKEKLAMKMIVSDLKLSESESDSGSEFTETVVDNALRSRTSISENNVPYPVSGIIMAAQQDNIFEIVKNTDDFYEKASELQHESPVTISVSVNKEVDEFERVRINDHESVVIINHEQSSAEHDHEDEAALNCDILLSEKENSYEIQDSLGIRMCGPDPRYLHLNKSIPPTNDFKTENSHTVNQDVTANTTVDIEEENNVNISDSDIAVKSLESETFQGINDGPQDDLMYYAVEVSDDYETNEAVVNLETVELEQGEVVIDNTRSDLNIVNAVETRVLHSEVSDALEVADESLNEEVIENFSEEKQIDLLEAKIHQVETDKHLPIYYPAVNETKSKYLYGINEDSQSSDEILEELIMDNIVNDTDSVDTEQVIRKEFDVSVSENHLEEPMDLSETIDNCEITTPQVFDEPYDLSMQSFSDKPVNSDNMLTDAVDVTMTEASESIDMCNDSSS